MNINCYFSSTDNISERIATQILNAKDSILLAMYTLTDKGLIDALKEKRRNGIDILTIFDEVQLTKFSNIVFELNNADIVFKTIGKEVSRMHHKFLIVDRNIVITGSFNWTHQANKSNMENIIIVENKNIVKNYMAEFDRIWQLISSKNIREYLPDKPKAYIKDEAYAEAGEAIDYIKYKKSVRANYSLIDLRDTIAVHLRKLAGQGKYTTILEIIDHLDRGNLTIGWVYTAELKRRYRTNSKLDSEDWYRKAITSIRSGDGVNGYKFLTRAAKLGHKKAQERIDGWR